jgi:hypothetical protein
VEQNIKWRTLTETRCSLFSLCEDFDFYFLSVSEFELFPQVDWRDEFED